MALALRFQKRLIVVLFGFSGIFTGCTLVLIMIINEAYSIIRRSIFGHHRFRFQLTDSRPRLGPHPRRLKSAAQAVCTCQPGP